MTVQLCSNLSQLPAQKYKLGYTLNLKEDKMDTCPKNHEKFVDFDKCSELIKELQTKLDLKGDGREEDEARIRCDSERLVESFRKVIDTYQEQPELLDPYLSELIQGLTSG